MHKKATTVTLSLPAASRGNSSMIAVTTVSTMANWLSAPSMNNIRKKSTDHSGDAGIIASPSGYATNARPGPPAQNTHWSFYTFPGVGVPPTMKAV